MRSFSTYGSNNDPILLTPVVPIVLLSASSFSASSHLCLSFNRPCLLYKEAASGLAYAPLKCHFQCGTRLLSARCSGPRFLIEDPGDSSQHRRRRWKTAPRGRFNRLFLGRLSVVAASVIHRPSYLYSIISSDVAFSLGKSGVSTLIA